MDWDLQFSDGCAAPASPFQAALQVVACSHCGSHAGDDCVDFGADVVCAGAARTARESSSTRRNPLRNALPKRGPGAVSRRHASRVHRAERRPELAVAAFVRPARSHACARHRRRLLSLLVTRRDCGGVFHAGQAVANRSERRLARPHLRRTGSPRRLVG